ncbi:MAG: hypothetical protein C4541_13550 [Candidatus Auribacter fodinae]|jgi:hypothetical protein|uniref:Uncharacterized protein n=1 Tax=Candidatus Auribacter fodinae TaxID=2093366 RepID=A0A3A4QUT7_9BACT|nr:MAG: hypothetical protein C4541_13550 [Candidatus Auribacter fodinae]
MRKSYWKTFELARLGVHPRTIRAIMRIQRRQQYSDQKYEQFKIQLSSIAASSLHLFDKKLLSD